MAAKTAAQRGMATPAQAAEYMGYAVGTLRKWRCLGQGPDYVGSGHGVRYPWASLDAWIARHTHRP